MLKNYIKIAIRNLKARKAFSIINITGLAVGMAGAILILLWVQNEYSFDSFHANNKTLYKVWYKFVTKDYTGTQDVVAGPLSDALKQGYPEVKSESRIYWSTVRLFNYKEVSIKAKGNDVDKAFLTMFSFPLLQGNAEHAFDDENNILLTHHLAKKIFNNANPINQLVKLDNKQIYKVSGVLKDLPDNTEFDFEYLVKLPASGAFMDNSWNNNSYYAYVQLQPNANLGQVNKKIANVYKQHVPENKNTEVFLYPFSKMHLYSRFDNGIAVGGRIEVIRLLLIIAGIILLIACINFMNLSTAQSQKRAREVGVRKVMGAARLSLISQFLVESIGIVFIAILFAFILVELSLPSFNQLTSKSLTINFADPNFWLAFFGFILITGLLAGSYPAFYLSAFRPVKVLKGKINAVKSVINPRKVMVVLQFTVAIVLIITTAVIYRQIKFVQSRDTGFSLNNLIEVPVEGDIRKNYPLIRNELLASGVATSTCQTSYNVTVDGSSQGGFSTDGVNKDQQNLSISTFATSGNFIKTMGLKLLDGRDIDFNTYPSDSTSCMLNETAVKQLNIKNPVGSFIKSGTSTMKVVGVFKDFIIRTPYLNQGPMIVFGSKYWIWNTLFRFNPQQDMAKNLRKVERIFKKYNPAYPFTYEFVDKEYQLKFADQQQTGRLSAIFAGLTIFISCLGLFGLALYMAETRAKEIGIRKVLGASVANITRMLTNEFVLLVVIAFIIATPIAWWAMNKWLQDFTYRINIGWVTFLAVGLTAILIAVLTVSFQSIKAAIANPVNSIKSE